MLNDAVVAAALGAAKLMLVGPDTWLHANVAALPTGTPFSIAEAARAADAGKVTF